MHLELNFTNMNYILVVLGWMIHILMKMMNAKAKHKKNFYTSKWLINNFSYVLLSIVCTIVLIMSVDLSYDFDKKIELAGLNFHFVRIVSLMLGLCATSIIDLIIKLSKQFIKI